MLENYLSAHILTGSEPTEADPTDDTRHPKSDRGAAAGRPESTS